MTTVLLLLPGAAGAAAIAAGLIAEHLAPPTGPSRTAPALNTCRCGRPYPTATGPCHLGDTR
ncbi:MAG TPA: hypothetical protein VFY14_10940 [Streptomyces sp.]|nr:hypothetical protein [Streptomyces sp.]